MPTDSDGTTHPAADEFRALGGLRPVRLAEWVERDGVVVLACPRPNRKGWRDIPAWFRWWTGPQRLRLDDVGSAVWLRIDGETNLAGITRDIEGTLDQEDSEALDQRVALFVQALHRAGMLELRVVKV